jgi:hypothetical protein
MLSDGFDKLPIDEKGEITFGQGKFIAQRFYYNQTIALYSLEDEFIEVWYLPNENRIGNIKLMEDIKTLDLYIDFELQNQKGKM